MSKTLKILFFLCVLGSMQVKAQLSKKISISLEFSSNTTEGTMRENWAVRQMAGSSYYDTHFGITNRLNTNFEFNQFGIRPEYSIINDKLIFSSGIRFTHLFSEFSKKDSNRDNFFYIRYGSSPLLTEYARVISINETSMYLGLPFELQYIFFRFLKFAPFIRIGTEIGFKVNESKNINFYSPSMESLRDDILQQYSFATNKLFSTTYSSLGFSLGSVDRVNYNMEFLLPSFFTTDRNSSLLNIDKFSGVRLSVKVPLNSFRLQK